MCVGKLGTIHSHDAHMHRCNGNALSFVYHCISRNVAGEKFAVPRQVGRLAPAGLSLRLSHSKQRGTQPFQGWDALAGRTQGRCSFLAPTLWLRWETPLGFRCSHQTPSKILSSLWDNCGSGWVGGCVQTLRRRDAVAHTRDACAPQDKGRRVLPETTCDVCHAPSRFLSNSGCAGRSRRGGGGFRGSGRRGRASKS
jgi:hypothetical protein